VREQKLHEIKRILKEQIYIIFLSTFSLSPSFKNVESSVVDLKFFITDPDLTFLRVPDLDPTFNKFQIQFQI
jgi:hypothetical protein